MRRFSCHLAGLLAAGLFGSITTAATAAPQAHEDLDVHGERYPHACKTGERKALKASLDRLKLPATPALWRAVDTLLCAPATPANARQVRLLLGPRTKMTYEDTGSDPDVVYLPPSEELVREVMAKGQAWRVTVEWRGEGVALQYAPNEACIAGVLLAYRGGKWWIAEGGSACD
ncbi:hypothetical protein [Massilia sp. MS-15]|uniref:hypothetical protein n=1 Tax=Massilia sp. MS-15 TaxID=2878200 RepID=UPI001CD28AB1|nr:hypothetical protein [Massilia sp. MS-15]MCA1247188.1 hypothetical protein [Massilia sp. MS-15]